MSRMESEFGLLEIHRQDDNYLYRRSLSAQIVVAESISLIAEAFVAAVEKYTGEKLDRGRVARVR